MSAATQDSPAPAGGEARYPAAPYAWYVAGVLTAGYVFAFADRLIIGLLTPAIKRDLALSDTEAGLLQGFAFAIFYTLFGLPLGSLADRASRKRILAIGMTVWSVTTSACGLSTRFWPLFLTRIGVGIGEATLNPCSTSLLGDYFPPRTRSRAFGLFVAATAIGTWLAFTGGGLVLARLTATGGLDVPLAGHLSPWQGTFFLLGLPGLIPALLLALTVREPPRLNRAAPGAQAVPIWPFFRANAATVTLHHVGASMVIMALYAYAAWLPSLFQRSYGWDPAQFSIAFGFPGGLAGTCGAISAGFVAAWQKRRGDPIATLRVCAIGAALSAVGGVLTPLMPTGEGAFVAYTVTALFNNYVSVLGLTAITEMAPNELRARLTATYVVGTGLISSTLGPLAVGVISDALSPDPRGIAYALIAVCALIALPGAGLLALAWKPYRVTIRKLA